ncbi:hypothetical protein [Tateyamaria pelophila]|uniref:hypothetical protein n=1 Tax=Tateyamaria pelophila TaxID=328415 RepID=UPI001CC058BD|nr:hypothetical protein [Tateyamaria pelophila]
MEYVESLYFSKTAMAVAFGVFVAAVSAYGHEAICIAPCGQVTAGGTAQRSSFDIQDGDRLSSSIHSERMSNFNGTGLALSVEYIGFMSHPNVETKFIIYDSRATKDGIPYFPKGDNLDQHL